MSRKSYAVEGDTCLLATAMWERQGDRGQETADSGRATPELSSLVNFGLT